MALRSSASSFTSSACHHRGQALTSEHPQRIPKESSLTRRKVYQILPDPKAAKDDLVRIVDESGEDYLYHKSYFVFVDFPAAVKKKLLALESVA